MNIEELKAKLYNKKSISSPHPAEIIDLNRNLMQELTYFEEEIRRSGKWDDVCKEILREPLEVIFSAIEVNKGKHLTLLTKTNLDDIQVLAEQVLREGIMGDFFEAGVFRGGVAILLRAIQCKNAESHRKVWAADTFAGIPAPDFERESAAEIVSFLAMRLAGSFSTTLEDVKENFSRFNLLDENVIFIKGNFEKTFPEINNICLSLLRLDCQYGHSSKIALEYLYPHLAVGGILLMNDYDYADYWGAKEAIDLYRRQHSIQAPIHLKGTTGYWRKEEHI